MKLQSELKHSITVENEGGEKVVFNIDPSDVIQVANITEVFAKFDELKELSLDVEDKKDIKDILKVVRPFANKLKEVNALLDESFGENITKIAFMGSSSLLLYNDFFEKLGEELELISDKTNSYVKKLRSESLVNDYKQSDTI